MARTDTNFNADVMPWSPLSATASIYPALLAPSQDEGGAALLAAPGGPLPFGLDLEAPEPEGRA